MPSSFFAVPTTERRARPGPSGAALWAWTAEAQPQTTAQLSGICCCHPCAQNEGQVHRAGAVPAALPSAGYRSGHRVAQHGPDTVPRGWLTGPYHRGAGLYTWAPAQVRRKWAFPASPCGRGRNLHRLPARPQRRPGAAQRAGEQSTVPELTASAGHCSGVGACPADQRHRVHAAAWMGDRTPGPSVQIGHNPQCRPAGAVALMQTATPDPPRVSHFPE